MRRRRRNGDGRGNFGDVRQNVADPVLLVLLRLLGAFFLWVSDTLAFRVDHRLNIVVRIPSLDGVDRRGRRYGLRGDHVLLAGGE